MITRNRHFNDPNMAAIASNLSSLFAPPEAADVANYATADARRADMNRLGQLFEYSQDPNLDQTRFDRMGAAAGQWTPSQGYYSVDRGYQAATENNVRDNARALAERQMIEEATKQRLGIPDVNARYKVDSEAAVSGSNNLRDNQTKAITTLLGPLDPGQVRPEVAADVMGLLEMPGIGAAAGAPKPLTAAEWDAQQRARLLDNGQLTDEMLIDTIMGERAPVQAVGPDGRPVYMSPGAAVRQGASPAPKEQPTGMSVTLADGTVIQQGGKALTEGQSKDSVYFTRASGAIPKLDQYGEALTEITGRIGSATEKAGGNFIKSREYQLAEQAGLEFLQAILRKDTGAAITKEEQSEYGRVYLPQPGDSAELLDQKKASRARALAAIRLGLPPDAIINAERAGVDLSVSAMPTEQTATAASAEPTAPVYATNPRTGERLVLRNGAWEPAQ